MTLKKPGYKPRLIDATLAERLKIFGAVSLEGPKWCGKTWTALNHANSAVFLDDSADNFDNRTKAQLNASLILDQAPPELVDEWSEVPEIWDAVRHKCDADRKKGKYILTDSTTLRTPDAESKIHHSGAGRIERLRMQPMSSFESGDSSGEVSLTALFQQTQKDCSVKSPAFADLATLIVRGGWPENIETDPHLAHILPKSYINAVLAHDLSRDDIRRDASKMEVLLKSLARNESTVASIQTLLADVEYAQLTRNTTAEYLDVLQKLYLTENQPAYTENLRSRDSVGKSAKRHFTDPSIACAALDISPDRLQNDIRTFGLFFEALAERDLRIYTEHLGGKLKHYRNNKNGNEVDAIVELPDGKFGAIEIKLGNNGITEAKENLLQFTKEVEKAPAFLGIICGLWDAVVRDPATGIYIFPLTALKP